MHNQAFGPKEAEAHNDVERAIRASSRFYRPQTTGGPSHALVGRLAMEASSLVVLQWKNESCMVRRPIEVDCAMSLAEFKRLCAEALGVEEMRQRF